MFTTHNATNNNTTASFDIRDHIDKLEPTHKKGRYICPVCEGENLTINEANGAYQCWNGCETADIRNAIAPLEEKRRGTRTEKRHGKKSSSQKPKQHKPAPIPEGAKVLRMEYPGDSPARVPVIGTYPSKVPSDAQNVVKILYPYSDNQWAIRYQWDDETKPKGYDKTFKQCYRNEDGVIISKKGDRPWKPYRIDEVLAHINDVEVPALLWGEGEKCVEIARSEGTLSTTLQGSSWSVKAIEEGLQPLKEASPQCIQVFLIDSDETGRQKGEKFEKACASVGLPCVIIPTDKIFEVDGDIEEILQSMDTPEFIKKLEEELHSASQRDLEKLQSAAEAPEMEHPGTAECKLAQKYNLIAAAWGYRLRWNSMKKRVEMDGQPLPLDRIKLRIAKELDIEVSKEDALEIVLDLAQDNEYSPFKEYLEALPSGNPEFLNSLASRFLGTHDPLHQVLLKRTLIAAVARTFQPGCKHDTICILKGKQGALKSTFWSVLAGEDNFTDDLSGTDKDEILKLSQYAMIEFSEFETAYKKKEVSALKAFLSRKSDSIRVPYGRDIQDIPRPSIFVGTTNKPEFLHDPTGERRYWAVPVECDRIDIPQLKIDRDAIWSAAKAAYLGGEQWWLTNAEDEMLNVSNSDFASTDVWEEAISGYISLCSETSVKEILSECLKIDVSMQDRASQMRVSEIFTRLGWVKGKKKKINSQVIQCWNKPIQKCVIEVATGVTTGVATGGSNPSNADISMHTENEVATVATFSSNLENNESKIKIKNENNNSSSQQSFEKVGSNQGGENARMQAEREIEQVATPPVATSIKEQSTVYPTSGRYEGKECKVSAVVGNKVWALPTHKKGKGEKADEYEVGQLSLTAPVKEVETPIYEELDLFATTSYDYPEEGEFLKGYDD